ncbi:MAG: hypothetical protein ACYTG7_25930 [Planctomycetota bacterium]|jgi:hypothetical protein
MIRKTIYLSCVLVCAAWMAWIGERYFSFHPEYLDALRSFGFFPVLSIALLALYLGWAFYQRILRGEKQAAITITPFRIIIGYFLFTLLVGALYFFFAELEGESSLWKIEGAMIASLAPLLATMLYLAIVAYGAGKKLLKLLGLEVRAPLDDFLLSTGLGLCCLAVPLGLIGFLGFFKPPVLWGFLILATLLFCREEKEFVQDRLFRKCTFRIHVISWEPLLLLLLFAGAASHTHGVG